jgi:uncharacterized membrane protein YqaE (UPF0057 family)
MKKIFTRILLIVLASAFMVPDLHAISYMKPAANQGDPDPATVKAAISEFAHLSRKEKKERWREVKKEVRAFKAAQKAHQEPIASTVVQVIVAILLPPLGVFLHEGVINGRFWIDLILTLIFYFPGLIYALIVILGSTSKG